MRSSSIRRRSAFLHGEATQAMATGLERKAMQEESSSFSPHGAALPRRQFSISSRVIPELMVALDSVVILSVAAISYFMLVGDYVEDASYYGAAVAFFWLVTIMLLNFAGLYQFEPTLRPLAFADKIAIAF